MCGPTIHSLIEIHVHCWSIGYVLYDPFTRQSVGVTEMTEPMYTIECGKTYNIPPPCPFGSPNAGVGAVLPRQLQVKVGGRGVVPGRGNQRVGANLAHLSRSATLHGLGPRPIPSCRLKVLLKNIFKNITFFI